MDTELYEKDGEKITVGELIVGGMQNQQRIGTDVTSVKTAILLSEPGFFKTGIPKDVYVVCFKKTDKIKRYNAYNTQRHITIFSREIFKILGKEDSTKIDLKTHLGIKNSSELQIVIFPRRYAARQLFDLWASPLVTNIFRTEQMEYLLGDGTKEKIRAIREASQAVSAQTAAQAASAQTAAQAAEDDNELGGGSRKKKSRRMKSTRRRNKTYRRRC